MDTMFLQDNVSLYKTEIKIRYLSRVNIETNLKTHLDLFKYEISNYLVWKTLNYLGQHLNSIVKFCNIVLKY